MKNADDEFNARKAPLLAAILERVSDADQLLSMVRRWVTPPTDKRPIILFAIAGDWGLHMGAYNTPLTIGFAAVCLCCLA